jgi:hypothetical protein
MQKRHMSFLHIPHIVCQEKFCLNIPGGPTLTVPPPSYIDRGTKPMKHGNRKTKTQPPLNNKRDPKSY